MSKQRCQLETTATEFPKWITFFREEDEREEAPSNYAMIQEFYWAQMAMYICKVNAKHPDTVRLDQFYYKGKRRQPDKKPKTREEATTKAKRWWGMFLGAASAVVKPKPKKNR